MLINRTLSTLLSSLPNVSIMQGLWVKWCVATFSVASARA